MQSRADRQEIAFSWYVPFGSYGAKVGRFANVFQVVPPSVVSAASGATPLVWSSPTTQQTASDTQSRAFSCWFRLEMVAGVLSDQVFPEFVLSAISGAPVDVFTPATQQTDLDGHETAFTDGPEFRLAKPRQCAPASSVTTTPCGISPFRPGGR